MTIIILVILVAQYIEYVINLVHRNRRALNCWVNSRTNNNSNNNNHNKMTLQYKNGHGKNTEKSWKPTTTQNITPQMKVILNKHIKSGEKRI